MSKIDKSVGFWASNPIALLRLQKIVRLSQRTSFIMQLMSLKPEEESLLKTQIKAILTAQGIEYNPPRGNAGANNPKIYSAAVRFSLAVIICILHNSADGGVDFDSESGRLDSGEWVDRLINAYHLYLQLSKTNPQEAEVSFELFVTSWTALQQSKGSICNCTNCGSSHFTLHISPAQACPVCSQLKLAALPKDARSKVSRHYKPSQPAYTTQARSHQQHSNWLAVAA